MCIPARVTFKMEIQVRNGGGAHETLDAEVSTSVKFVPREIVMPSVLILIQTVHTRNMIIMIMIVMAINSSPGAFRC